MAGKGTQQTLREHVDRVEVLASELFDKEELDEEQVAAILDERRAPVDG